MTTVNDEPTDQRWLSLTEELQSRDSPVRGFLADLSSSSLDLRKRHQQGAGAVRVPRGEATPATVGAAFDFALRLIVAPDPNLALAAWGASPEMCGERVAEAFLRLVTDLDAHLDPDHTAAVAEPRMVPDRDREMVLRAAWALALLTEVSRLGMVMPGSPLTDLLGADHPIDLLTLATPAVVDELDALVELAEANLMPHLTARPAPWYIGPTFAGSSLMPADADIIAGGLLLEIKVKLGQKRPDGTHYAYLEPATLHQLIGYALLDFDDRYRITDLGCYDARYGHLSVWPLAEFLTEAAGRSVDVAATRREFRRLLNAGRNSGEVGSR